MKHSQFNSLGLPGKITVTEFQSGETSLVVEDGAVVKKCDCGKACEGSMPNGSCSKMVKTDSGENWWCTLPKGHEGDHIACVPVNPHGHNLYSWPNTEPISEWPKYYLTADEDGVWRMDNEHDGKFFFPDQETERSDWKVSELESGGAGARKISQEEGRKKIEQIINQKSSG